MWFPWKKKKESWWRVQLSLRNNSISVWRVDPYNSSIQVCLGDVEIAWEINPPLLGMMFVVYSYSVDKESAARDAMDRMQKYMESEDGKKRIAHEQERHAKIIEREIEERRRNKPATVGVMEDLIYEIKRLRDSLG